MPEKPESELNEQARQRIEELKATIRQEVFSEQKRHHRTQLIYAGLGIIIGVAVSAALFQWWDTIAKIQPLLVGVLVVAILAVGGAAVAFIWFRDSIFGKFFKAGVASYEAGIENATQTFVPLLTKLLPKLDTAELQNGIDALKKSGLQIAAYFAYIRARRMVFGWLVALAAGLAAFLGTTLLVKQNELLREQTSLAKQQAHLTEAARRSSYVMLMDNILNQVNEELKGADTTPYHLSRRLSTVTIGRIAALSQSLRPIRYLVEGDSLSRYLSPERGQLLLALVYARLDTTHTYPEIYAKSDFSYADLEGAKLESAFLERVNLSKSNLMLAQLSKANLKKANLEEAILSLTKFSRGKLEYANLSNANLELSNLNFSDLSKANLTMANLSSSWLVGADLTKADLSETNLKGADLFGSSGLLRIIFWGPDDYFKEELIYELTKLDSAKVHSYDCIEKSERWEVKGRDTILQKYKIDTLQYGLFFKKYYLILPKNK